VRTTFTSPSEGIPATLIERLTGESRGPLFRRTSLSSLVIIRLLEKFEATEPWIPVFTGMTMGILPIRASKTR
jgi:hypothetical protein